MVAEYVGDVRRADDVGRGKAGGQGNGTVLQILGTGVDLAAAAMGGLLLLGINFGPADDADEEVVATRLEEGLLVGVGDGEEAAAVGPRAGVLRHDDKEILGRSRLVVFKKVILKQCKE